MMNVHDEIDLEKKKKSLRHLHSPSVTTVRVNMTANQLKTVVTIYMKKVRPSTTHNKDDNVC